MGISSWIYGLMPVFQSPELTKHDRRLPAGAKPRCNSDSDARVFRKAGFTIAALLKDESGSFPASFLKMVKGGQSYI
jgi:hypothetical protein